MVNLGWVSTSPLTN